MSETTLAAGLAVILGGGAAAITYLLLDNQGGGQDRVYVETSAGEDRYFAVPVAVAGKTIVQTARPAVFVPQDADVSDVLGALAIKVGESYGQPLVEGVTRIAGDAIANGSINLTAVATPVQDVTQGGALSQVFDLANPFDAGGVLPSRDEIGGAVTSLGENVSQVFITAGIKLAGLRGATDEEQEALLAKTALSTVQSILSGVIPVFGAAFSAGLGVLAGTYEGQKVLAEVGEGLQDLYDAQKDLVAGNVSAALGLESHKRERIRRLLAAIREVQPVDDLRYLAAIDEAARGTYRGDLAGTDLSRFDASLRAESTLNAALLQEYAEATAALEAQNEANTAATLEANAAYVAAGLFTILDQLREWRASDLTKLGASRSSMRTTLDYEWTWKINAAKKAWNFSLAASLTAERDAALVTFDAETKRITDAIYADYAARAAAEGGTL